MYDYKNGPMSESFSIFRTSFLSSIFYIRELNFIFFILIHSIFTYSATLLCNDSKIIIKIPLFSVVILFNLSISFTAVENEYFKKGIKYDL